MQKKPNINFLTKLFSPFIAAFFIYVFFAAPHQAKAYVLIDFGTVSLGDDVSGHVTKTANIQNNNPTGGLPMTANTNTAPSWFTMDGLSSLSGTLPANTTSPVTIALTSKSTDGTWAVGTYTFSVTLTTSSGTQNASDYFDVRVNIDNNGPLAAPTAPVATNSGGASGNCNVVYLNWNTGVGATGYDVYRNGTQILTNYSGLSYTDNAVTPGTSYTYTIDSYRANGNKTSSQATFSNTPIIPNRCVADFSTSDKVITALNGNAQPYTSTCVANGSGTTATIKNGDTLSFQLDLCNTGSVPALSVSVKDTLVQNLQNPRNYKINGVTTTPTISGNTITFNVGTINNGSTTLITFDADVPSSLGSTQALQRLENDGDITYTTAYILPGDVAGGNGNCKSSFNNSATACHISTGLVVFYNGLKTPTQKEFNP